MKIQFLLTHHQAIQTIYMSAHPYVFTFPALHIGKNYMSKKRLRIFPTGTTIKDTWTKPRGRVEVGEGGGFSWGGVEGWGEKAYNCN